MKKTLSLLAVAALMIVAACTGSKAQQTNEPQANEQQQGPMGNPLQNFPGQIVYQDSNVVWHQMDEHLWIGHGHVMSMETMYIVEGNDRAVLIDAGTKIDHLDEIVKKITKKPYDVLITHVHPDHVGAVDCFPEIWINEADTVNIPAFMPNYKGKVHYIQEGQQFDLGGRVLEAVFTPGHTPGSTTFLDVANHYGFSGDSFGNGNLLLTTDFSTLIKNCENAAKVMADKDIKFFYCGHYFGSNPETPQRVQDLITISKGALSGEIKGEDNPNGMVGLNKVIRMYGVNVNYSDAQLK